MKKLITYILLGLFCFTTATGVAQTTKETPQGVMLRLKIENRLLQIRVKTLMQQHKNTPNLKPYYKNIDIQNQCEQFPKCAQWAKNMYQNYVKTKHPTKWQIIEVKYKQQFIAPYWLDKSSQDGETFRQIEVRTQNHDIQIFRQCGPGKFPTEWEDI